MSYTGVFGEWLAESGISPDHWRRLNSESKLLALKHWQGGSPPQTALGAKLTTCVVGDTYHSNQADRSKP